MDGCQSRLEQAGFDPIHEPLRLYWLPAGSRLPVSPSFLFFVIMLLADRTTHRHLCQKLFLKAETQQVDRILEDFGRRYHECNPTGLFGSPGTHLLP